MASRANLEAVHRRVPFPHSGRGHGARDLGTGGPKPSLGFTTSPAANGCHAGKSANSSPRAGPQLKPGIEPGSLKDYRGAPRAPDTSLNCAKAQKLLSFRLPGLTEWLAAHPNETF